MKIQDLKTIDVKTLTWFDKVNGNTYFAQEITLNFGMQNEKTLINPFQYGYSSFDYKAIELVKDFFNIDKKNTPSHYFRDLGVIIRSSERKALKRELKALSR